ncbi:MAG: FecCD family ABC transporter permease [Steroidobacteraceae bacterium]
MPLKASPSFTPVLLSLSLCSLLSLGVALCLGSVPLAAGDLWTLLNNRDSSLEQAVLLNLRLPRALTSFALGGLLSLAGIYMQVLLRNPLADPYIMGTSGGAAVAALGAMLLGMTGMAIQGAAAFGAFAAILLVFALAHAEGSWSPTRLLLTGVVVAAGTGALVSLLLALGDEARLRGMLFWLMGDIATYSRVTPLWTLLLLASGLSYLLARHLNVLARGELQAQTLGMNIKQMRIGLFAASALLTAAVVTTAGSIGFVGLITPHLARLLVGADHRRVAPAAVLLGGSLLTLADTAARTLFAPHQLPVGALTALIGVPVFLTLMYRRKA